MAHRIAPITALFALMAFWLAVSSQERSISPLNALPPSVTLPASTQILLYGGDRFLAANIEEIRTAASVTTTNTQVYRTRAHLIVSRLNPCHEDNYWIGNASLSWGGAEEQGFELLTNAVHCRFWDEWHAFFYGFNQHFFLHNIPEARRVLEIAALRSPKNAAAFRNFSIMLAAGKIDDIRMALETLQNERKKAKDLKLREMLDDRIVRLNGLLTLRDAQSAFEERFNMPLTHPQELLSSGLLEAYPNDPLGLGYEFREQRFHLKKMKIK